MRLRSRHRPCRAARLVAASAALLLVAGQLGTFAHLVTVRHELCAEHGELVDVHDGPAAGWRGPVADAANNNGSRFAASSRAAAGHQHEHCAIAPHRRDSSAGARLEHAIGEAPAVVATFAVSPVPSVARAVYRLAPKTSPPA
jgi:hypothetical protein